MQLRKTTIFAISLASFFHLAEATNKTTYYGYANLNHLTQDAVEIDGSGIVEDSKFNFLTTNGSLDAKDVTVKNLSTKGSLKAQNLVTDNLTVLGSAYGERVTVSGKTSISGWLNMIDSKFANIEFTTGNATLESTSVSNIIFTNPNAEGQKLTLRGNSVVEGDITFKSGKGEVVLGNNSKIKGKVVGGNITSE